MLFLDRVMIPPPLMFCLGFGLTAGGGGGAGSCGDGCEVVGGD